MTQNEARGTEVAAHDGSRKESFQTTVPNEIMQPTRTRVEGQVDGRVEANGQFDLAEVAAKLPAQDGRITAEFSGDLGLEIILKRIVEQARLATGASGAAIALISGGEMVCRATSGENAPDLGMRLNTTEGLSGACVRSLQIKYCHDALTDTRVNAEISRQMGVRSVVVYPVLQDESLIGILEIFSSRAAAFGDRDLQTLEVLAGSIVKNRRARDQSMASEETASPLSGETESVAIETIQSQEGGAIEEANAGGASAKWDVKSWDDRNLLDLLPAKRFDWFAAVSGAVIIGVALMMATAFVMRAGWLKHGAANRSQMENPSASAPALTPADSASVDTGSNSSKATQKLTLNSPVMKQAANSRNSTDIEDARIPAGSLLVYENGREIFRAQPSKSENRATSTSITEASPDGVGNVLERQVEPRYPEKARAERVQGPVVLHVRTDRDGTVQEVRVLKGDPLLAEAATAAVAQWKFKPRFVNGRKVEIETEITLKFTLPPN